MSKICLKCMKELPSTEFHRSKAKMDGLTTYCKDCSREHRKTTRFASNETTRKREARDREAMNDYWWKKISRYHGLDFREMQSLFKQQHEKCFYCKTGLSSKNLHIEHYYPKSDERIVIACCDCNRLKWRRNGDEFTVFLKEYVSRFL